MSVEADTFFRQPIRSQLQQRVMTVSSKRQEGAMFDFIRRSSRSQSSTTRNLSIAGNGLRYTDLQDVLDTLKGKPVTVIFPGGNYTHTQILLRAETGKGGKRVEGIEVVILYNDDVPDRNKIAILISPNAGEVASVYHNPETGQVVILFSKGAMIVSS